MTKRLEPRLVTFFQDKNDLFSGPSSICKHTKLGRGWNLKTHGPWVMVSSPLKIPHPLFATIKCFLHFVDTILVISSFSSTTNQILRIRARNSDLRPCKMWISVWPLVLLTDSGVESCSEVLLHFHCALVFLRHHMAVVLLLGWWKPMTQFRLSKFKFQTSFTILSFVDQSKFRRQISDNMERWKAERRVEEKSRRDKEKEERRYRCAKR